LIMGGPACSDGALFWEIQGPGGLTGWVAEGGNSEDPYFICPLP
jgi:hypothetical protein